MRKIALLLVCATASAPIISMPAQAQGAYSGFTRDPMSIADLNDQLAAIQGGQDPSRRGERYGAYLYWLQEHPENVGVYTFLDYKDEFPGG